MVKFSLSRLIMCSATKYQRLSSQDYIKLGLCRQDNCLDCLQDQAHLIKKDKSVCCNVIIMRNLFINHNLPKILICYEGLSIHLLH